MVKLILIRHGHTLSNDAGTFTGQLESGLSDIGVKQSRFLAEYLTENFKPDMILTSDLSRAYQTIANEYYLTDVPIIKRVELREMYGGLWQGKTVDEIKRLYPDDYAFWKQDIGNACPTGGESMPDVQKRAIGVIDELRASADGKTVFIVSHGGVIRSLICHFMNLPLSEMKNIDFVPNASISEIDMYDSHFHIKYVGSDIHLHGLKTTIAKGF